MDDELVKLYELLVREGYYTKNLEDFVFKYIGEPGYKEKVFDVVSRDGFYTKSKEEFFDQYKLPDNDAYKDFYAGTVKKKTTLFLQYLRMAIRHIQSKLTQKSLILTTFKKIRLKKPSYLKKEIL